MLKLKINYGKNILTSTLFIFSCCCCLAQQHTAGKYIITGKVIDSLTRKVISYATITVTDSLQNNAGATYSGENGSFKTALILHGKYSLEISSIGYNTKQVSIKFSADQYQLQLDTIFLSVSSGVLKEITVSTRKKLVEQKPGMLVYNAENDLTNKGGTAADVLRKAPILNVDAQGNVTMRGSGNLKILINGKYSGQMARSPADALNMMPADIIKSVEVITNPSAKYDAEGAAGVINIITKKGHRSFSGTLEAAASNWEQVLNPRVSVAKNKWNINLNGHLHRLTRKSTVEINRNTIENDLTTLRLNQHVHKKNTAPHGSADLVIDYALDSVSELSMGVNAWFGKWPDNSNLNSIVRLPDGSITEQYMQTVSSRAAYLGSDINIGYNRKFKTPGQEITLLAQFSPGRDHSGYNSFQTGKTDELIYRELNNNKTHNREWTFQADFVQPLFHNNKNIIESGLKMIRRNVDNNYQVASSNPQQPDEMEPQPSRSDNFNYKQNVLAAYALLKITMRNDWYVETGVRVEETQLKGSFASAGTSFKNRFVNFIPTATLSKKIKEGQTLNMSYTKRLTRPYIWDLNPNINTSDPKNIFSGNPELKPEIAHQAELAYALTGSAGFFLNAALFWKQTNNAIIDFTHTDTAGISFTSKQNLAANRQYGLNLSSSVMLLEKWSLNGNINIDHLDFNSKALQIISTGWAADINVNTIYKLPRHYALQLFGEYNTRSVTLQGYKTYRYYYSVAAKKEIPQSKLIITLSAVNPFSKYIAQTEIINAPSFSSSLNNRYYNRAVKLTVNWEFGGMFEQKERKKISNDDVKEQGKG